MYRSQLPGPAIVDAIASRRYYAPMGTIYKRGEIYWIKGKGIKPESSGSTKKRDARALLRKREKEVEAGHSRGKDTDKVLFETLAADLITDYKVNNRRSLDRAQLSVDHLAGFFSGWQTIEITTEQINKYIIKRLEDKAANATINRELAALRRMFSLGYRQTPPKVMFVPYIPRLAEDNIRTGFLEYPQYVRLKAALPQYLKLILTLGYYTAMRRGEMLKLLRTQVDLVQGRIALESADTKNKTARAIYLVGELYEEVAAQVIWNEQYPDTNLLIHHDGEPVVNPREAWHKACIEAGVPKALIHDLRRTGARNMRRAGVGEKEIMLIAGWKTRSVFDRYNIIDESDIKQGAIKTAQYIQGMEKELK